MVYRAKVTRVKDIVAKRLDEAKYPYAFVKDAKDVYVEVKSEDLAYILESLNASEEVKELTLTQLDEELYALTQD